MWTWVREFGFMQQDGITKFRGYAGGDKGQRPDAVNNPALSGVPDVGPLPAGIYTIGEFADHPVVGQFAAELTPAPSNGMYGRSGFFIHGDNPEMNQSASDGCIVLEREDREAIAASGDVELEVV